MAAGGYPERFRWLRRQRAAGGTSATGQKTDTFTAFGHLWGVTDDVVGGRASAKESERQVTTATVRLRNYPDVRAGDRLDSAGTVWTVLHVVAGANEILCDVETPSWSAGGGTAS